MLRHIRKAALGITILAALGGCQKSPAPAPADGPATSASGKAGAYAVGIDAVEGRSALRLTVRAKGGFKLNDEYPHTFKPDAAASGVKFESTRYELWPTSKKTPCSAKPEASCTMEAEIPVAVGEAEPTAVGTLSFSVCDPERCLIEKVPVSVTIAKH